MSTIALAGRSNLLRLRSIVQRPVHSVRQPGLRHSSNKPPPPPAKNDSEAPWTLLPGPPYAFLEPVLTPFRAYGRMQRRSPYLTQLSSTLTIYFLGDLSSQMIAGSGSTQGYSYEPIRGIRAMVIGGFFAIPGFHWFMFLGKNFNYSSHIWSLCVKILVNQMVFTPTFNTYFFSMQTLLAGGTLQQAKRRVLETVPVSWANSWKVWPAVTAFSFTFVAPAYRAVFAGFVAIGWQTYLSWLNLRASQKDSLDKA